MSKRRDWVNESETADVDDYVEAAAAPTAKITTKKDDWKNAEKVVEYEEVDGVRFRVTKLLRKVTTHRPFSMVDHRASLKRFGLAAAPATGEKLQSYDALQVLELGMIDPVEQKCRDELHRMWGDMGNFSVTVKDARLAHWKEQRNMAKKLAPAETATASAAAEKATAAASSSGEGKGKTWSAAKREQQLAKASAAAAAGGAANETVAKNVVRVSNLADFITEAELSRLFGEENGMPHITKLYVAKDRETGQRRGFAYISYRTEAEGQFVVDRMQKTAFKNTILMVDFGTKQAGK